MIFFRIEQCLSIPKQAAAVARHIERWKSAIALSLVAEINFFSHGENGKSKVRGKGDFPLGWVIMRKVIPI